jgi:hypothetical protein
MGEVPNVEWTPDVKVHLLNPGQLFKDGYNVTLAREGAMVVDLKDRTVIQVSERGNTYPFELLTMPAAVTHRTYSILTDEDHARMLENPPMALLAKTNVDLMRWHQRLGHLSLIMELSL